MKTKTVRVLLKSPLKIQPNSHSYSTNGYESSYTMFSTGSGLSFKQVRKQFTSHTIKSISRSDITQFQTSMIQTDGFFHWVEETREGFWRALWPELRHHFFNPTSGRAMTE